MDNEQYVEYYATALQEDAFIILDNGAYEGARASEQKFIDRIHLYKPSVVVLPDCYLQPWEKTYADSKSFLDKYYSEFPDIEWMYVPQAPKCDIINWVEGVIEAIQTLPIEWVGIPRCLATDVHPHDEFIRVKACKWIKNKFPEIKIHALGMNSGNVKELHELALAGCDSIDSSAPVWRGWKMGLSLLNPDHHKIWKELGTEVEFDCPYNPLQMPLREDVILDNLEACGVDVSALKGVVD